MSNAERIRSKDLSDTVSAKVFSPNNKDSNDLYQKREKIYQRHGSGFFQRIRVTTIWLTLGVYFLGPWLTWGGRQAVLFDLPERKFYIFWFTFWPQDFLLLSWLLIIAAFALFFFTVIAGRVWCGYTCPQTVWTTFFMYLEYLTEGDRHQRIRLDAQPWNRNKLMRKTAKHTLWLGLAFWTAFTFVGYFTPVRELWLDILYLQAHGWAWFWLAFFTIATYTNAGWMREQVCIYMCPYARFQSVMFDKDTLIVTYDKARGEPRGSRKKHQSLADSDLGSCIDCKMCVQVCPTGIDIRDGLQYECITCAACIDACDSVMDKMNYPRGLIRYSTEHAMGGGHTHWLRPRLIGYGAVLSVMIIAFWTVLFTRVPLELDVIRDRNQIYRVMDNGQIENTYTVKIQNKAQQSHRYHLSVNGLEGLVLNIPDSLDAAAGELVSIPVRARLAQDQMVKPTYKIEFVVQALDDPSIHRSTESRFIGPRPER